MGVIWTMAVWFSMIKIEMEGKRVRRGTRRRRKKGRRKGRSRI